MHAMQLARVDLNLLPSLVVLLEQRSVSRAAEAVGLSQSAMSRTLARLRRLLDDELLVRSGDGGYRLTAVAEDIRGQLGGIVPQLESVFLGRDFDPAAQTREFRLASSDYALAALGTAVISAVLAGAPGASLRLLPWHSDIAQGLADGAVDLMLSGMRLPAPVLSEALFTDGLVCVVDRGHDLAHETSMTLDTYLGCGHVVIDIADGLQPAVDGVLSAMGRPRRAVVTVPYHAIAPLALAGTQLVVTLPTRVLAAVAELGGDTLRILTPPPELKALPYFMSWHARADGDKGHQWLRALVRAAAADLRVVLGYPGDGGEWTRPPDIGTSPTSLPR